MASQAQQKPIHSLILDTGPLIKNAVAISTIINSAEEIFTTPAILSEIRDESTRSRVQTTLMPFLKIRNPAPASYDAVIAFSKKTGDHAVLSRQDLGILALAYEVHCEKNGGPWGLREAPRQPVKKKPEENKDLEKEQQEQVSTADHDQTPIERQTAQNEEIPVIPETAQTQDSAVVQEKNDESSEQRPEVTSTHDAPGATEQGNESAPTIEDPMSKNPVSDELTTSQETTTTQEASQEPTTAQESISQDLAQLNISKETPPSPPDTDDSDSDGEWITPSNLTQRQAKDAGLQTARTSNQQQMDVATMTIDFAMQNVLLQMNLHLLSTNMQRIKHLSSKVLRCHACFNIVKQMDKQFCPRCGGASLQRVSCSTNAKGEFRIHLAKNYQYNKRGDKYSVPKPIAGTANGKWSGQGGGQGGWGRDLILAEDQKEYQKQIDESRRKGNKGHDLMDEDYLPNILTGDRGRAGGRPKVGAGRNVNSRKRF